VPTGAEWPSPSACAADEASMALCAVVSAVAIEREVLVAVSNKNILPMLSLFLSGLASAGIRNGLVAALDEPTAVFVRSR